MELKELQLGIAKIMLECDDDHVYFYDKEKDVFDNILMEEFESFIHTVDLEKFNEEDLDTASYSDKVSYSIISDNGKINIIIPYLFVVNEEDYIEFIKKENNQELNKCLDSKRLVYMFKNRIHKLDLYDKWIDFISVRYAKLINILLDAVGLYTLPALKWEYIRIMELANEIYKLKPWETFWDVDIIENKRHDDNTYYCVMGKAGQTFGLSMYRNKDLDGLKTILCSEESLDQLLMMSMQRNFTIYFDDIIPYSEETLFIEELGIKDKMDCAPSIMRFNQGKIFKNQLSNLEALEVINNLEDFVSFFKAFKKKPKDFDGNERKHLSFTVNKAIKIDTIEMEHEPINYLCDTTFVPPLMNYKLTKDEYEIDFRGLQIFRNDEIGRESSVGYVMLIMDRKSGRILYPLVIDGNNQSVLMDVYDGMQKFIDNNKTFAKKIVVANEFVADIFYQLFEGKLDIEIDEFKYLDEVFVNLKRLTKEERVFN